LLNSSAVQVGDSQERFLTIATGNAALAGWQGRRAKTMEKKLSRKKKGW
jgi:hypothetical protein